MAKIYQLVNVTWRWERVDDLVLCPTPVYEDRGKTDAGREWGSLVLDLSQKIDLWRVRWTRQEAGWGENKGKYGIFPALKNRRDNGAKI